MFDIQIKLITENLKDVEDYGMYSFETIPRLGEYIKLKESKNFYEVASVIYYNNSEYFEPTLFVKNSYKHL